MRRQRWRATLRRDGETIEKLILAYTRESVAEFYARQGWEVIKVESGRKPRATTRPDNPPWDLDDRAIREAREFLGLRHPVRLKKTGAAGGRVGAHQLRPTGGLAGVKNGRLVNPDTATGLIHHITLKSWQSAEQASRTIWHELTHALQAERAASELSADTPLAAIRAWNRVAARDRGIAYNRKSIEVEAREYESFAAEHPLVKERSACGY